MKTVASSTRGGSGLHRGPEGHTLYDVVLEQDMAPYLRSLPCDYQDRGALAQNKEVCYR